ncbi:MAG: hypothetical protein K9W44_00255 [Candidatus Lokiarchaeota archaeon]|nr:hypothetical protein [Candidatus Harpocratesius repetitus]
MPFFKKTRVKQFARNKGDSNSPYLYMLNNKPEIAIFVFLAVIMVFLALTIVIVVLVNYKKGKLKETPNLMQFSERDYRPGEGFIDQHP